MTIAVERRVSTIDEAATATARGEMVIVVGGKDREEEGSLVMAAQFADGAAINFMATHARGLICVPMLRERLDELGIPPMVGDGTADAHGAVLHVGVDLHRLGRAAGTSAGDRARAARALSSPKSTRRDFSRPGHLFPLAYTPGGVLSRAGHAEAAIDLLLIAGLEPAGVICDIADEDGAMARLPGLRAFARRHGLPMVEISELISHRRRREQLVVRKAEADLPLRQGRFRAIGYSDLVTGNDHLALVVGDLGGRTQTPLVRLQSACLAGDVLRSTRCQCGLQIGQALRMIAAHGVGALLYLRHDLDAGTGFVARLDTHQRRGGPPDPCPQAHGVLQPRDHWVETQMLADLGVDELLLLTTAPDNHGSESVSEGYGVRVLDRIQLGPPTPGGGKQRKVARPDMAMPESGVVVTGQSI